MIIRIWRFSTSTEDENRWAKGKGGGGFRGGECVMQKIGMGREPLASVELGGGVSDNLGLAVLTAWHSAP